MNASWWAVVMLTGGCLSGCYRYADVPLERVQTLQSSRDGRSLTFELQGGGKQKFAEYDELVVEIESHRDDETELELQTPLRPR